MGLATVRKIRIIPKPVARANPSTSMRSAAYMNAGVQYMRQVSGILKDKVNSLRHSALAEPPQGFSSLVLCVTSTSFDLSSLFTFFLDFFCCVVPILMESDSGMHELMHAWSQQCRELLMCAQIEKLSRGRCNSHATWIQWHFCFVNTISSSHKPVVMLSYFHTVLCWDHFLLQERSTFKILQA